MTQNPKSTFKLALTAIAWAAIPVQLLFLYILLTNKWSRPTLFVSIIEREFFLYLFAYMAFLVLGILVAVISKQWIALAVQALIPVTLIGLTIFSVILTVNQPKTKYDAKDFQHLIGRDIREVKSELGPDSAFSYGRGSGMPPYKSLWLRGMTILANEDDNIIFKVKPNLRE